MFATRDGDDIIIPAMLKISIKNNVISRVTGWAPLKLWSLLQCFPLICASVGLNKKIKNYCEVTVGIKNYCQLTVGIKTIVR